MDINNLRSWIRVKLGHPTVVVELNDGQLDVCIEDALSEIAPWIVQSEYVTLPVSQCIDMTEYNVSFVIRVHKSDGNISSNNAVDVFSTDTFLYTQSTSSLSGFSNMSRAFVERSIIDKMINNYKDNISFKFIKPNLYLDIGHPKSTMCVIEFTRDILSIDQITSPLYKQFLKNFSLAYARMMLYEIRGKYTVANSPTTLNAETELSQATQELEYLREQLKSSVSVDFILD